MIIQHGSFLYGCNTKEHLHLSLINWLFLSMNFSCSPLTTVSFGFTVLLCLQWGSQIGCRSWSSGSWTRVCSSEQRHPWVTWGAFWLQCSGWLQQLWSIDGKTQWWGGRGCYFNKGYQHQGILPCSCLGFHLVQEWWPHEHTLWKVWWFCLFRATWPKDALCNQDISLCGPTILEEVGYSDMEEVLGSWFANDYFQLPGSGSSSLDA